MRFAVDPLMPTTVLAVDDEAGVAVTHPSMPAPERARLLLNAGYWPDESGAWIRAKVPPCAMPREGALLWG